MKGGLDNPNMNSTSQLDGTRATLDASRTIQRDASAMSFLNQDQSMFIHDESRTQLGEATKRTAKSKLKSNNFLEVEEDFDEKETGADSDRSTKSGRVGRKKKIKEKVYTAEEHK